MKSGYEIRWTDNALKELSETYKYIKDNWSERELKKLSIEIEKTLKLISQNPNLFQKSASKNNIHRAVILKISSIFYRKNNGTIEIISFFSNRKNPRSLKL